MGQVIVSENAKSVAAEVLAVVQAEEAKKARKPRGERRNGPVRSNRDVPCAGGCGKLMTAPKLLSGEGPKTCLKCQRQVRKGVRYNVAFVTVGGDKFSLTVAGNEERFLRSLVAHGVTIVGAPTPI